jgi:ribosomal protein L34E
MPFSMPCTNKGCGKTQEPFIDPKDDKVYCSVCEKELANISHFTKVQMKSMKQFRQKNTTSFSVKCSKCGKEGRPKLSNNDVICSGCLKPLDNLSTPFKNMLKEKLKDVDKDV